ncbi:MAG TPA: hypothetical protein VIQ49_01980 [Williamsia sp.]
MDSLYDSADALGAAPAAPLPTGVLAALGGSLSRGDRRGKSYNVQDLLHGRRGPVGASSSGDGRDSGNAPLARQAARGSLVLDALQSVQAGEVPHLTEYGVNFSGLNGLSGLELFSELMRLILGPAAHPDDVALRQALMATMRTSASEPAGSLADTIGRFVSELAWRTTVVQLTASPRRGSVVKASLIRLEERVRMYIGGKVRQVTNQLVNATPQTVADFASSLAAKACRLFGKETETP